MCVNCIGTKTISENKWSNNNHDDLSENTYDYKSNDITIESNPINEGFIILSDNQKKQPLSTISSTSAGPIRKKPTSTARKLSNTTTRTTSISTRKTITKSLPKTTNHTINSYLDSSSARRGRRLLNDPSYDTDTDTSFDHANDVESFLKVNDEELSQQLLTMAETVDGSGYSMYQ
jgi:hypothetical protein